MQGNNPDFEKVIHGWCADICVMVQLGSSYNKMIGKLWGQVLLDSTYQELLRVSEAYERLLLMGRRSYNNSYGFMLQDVRNIAQCFDSFLRFESIELRVLQRKFCEDRKFLEPALMLLVSNGGLDE